MNWWSGKLVLITGARGFIGSKLKSILESLECVVLTKDRDTFRAHIPDNLDVIFHLAADTVVSEEKSTEMITNNFLSTSNILEFGKINKSKAIIIVSSDRVYGDEQNVRNPYREDDPLLARDTYGTSKVLCDILAQSYIKKRIPVGIARCSNVYGPGDRHMNRIIPSIVNSLTINEPPVLNTRSPSRDYIYIDDAVNALMLIAQYIYSGNREHSIFNFSSGLAIRNDDLLGKIIDIWGEKVRATIVQKDNEKFSYQCSNASRAVNILGWEQQFNLYSGLQKTVQWWREQNVRN